MRDKTVIFEGTGETLKVQGEAPKNKPLSSSDPYVHTVHPNIGIIKHFLNMFLSLNFYNKF